MMRLYVWYSQVWGQTARMAFFHLANQSLSVIAQDEKSSVVYGMPRAIYEAGVVDEVVTLSDVAKAITKNVGVK